MTTPEAALAAATLAMTVVKNEANDNYGTWTWTVEQGAERFLEVMRNEGYALTPLAPEVPPREDGLREAVEAQITGLLSISEPLSPIERGNLGAYQDVLNLIDRLAATRTPEPPDSGDGARCRDLGYEAHAWVNTGSPSICRDCGMTFPRFDRLRLRSGSPAPEGGE